VEDAAGKSVGVVGQDSRIFARGLEDRGALSVKWGDGPLEMCRINYTLPQPTDKMTGYLSVESQCVIGAQLEAATGLKARVQGQAIAEVH
jgi:outer membrane usher protein